MGKLKNSKTSNLKLIARVWNHAVPVESGRTQREEEHKANNPNYVDPEYYLNATQKYFFRHESLQHLRLEQYSRYFSQGSPFSTARYVE